MPHDIQITGTDGVNRTWLVELDADGCRHTLVPVAALPDVVPVWTIRLSPAPPAAIPSRIDTTKPARPACPKRAA